MKKIFIALFAFVLLVNFTALNAEEKETITMTAVISKNYESYQFSNFEYFTSDRIVEGLLYVNDVLVLDRGETVRGISHSFYKTNDMFSEGDDNYHLFGYQLSVNLDGDSYALWFATDYTYMPSTNDNTVEMERGDVALWLESSAPLPVEIKLVIEVDAEETITPIVTETNFNQYLEENMGWVWTLLRSLGVTGGIILTIKLLPLIKKGRQLSVHDIIDNNLDRVLDLILKQPENIKKAINAFRQTDEGKQVLDNIDYAKDNLLLTIEGQILDYQSNLRDDVYDDEQSRLEVEEHLRKLVDKRESLRNNT